VGADVCMTACARDQLIAEPHLVAWGAAMHTVDLTGAAVPWQFFAMRVATTVR